MSVRDFLLVAVLTAISCCYVVSQVVEQKVFSCEGRPNGYYADVSSGCQIYHMCDGLGRQFSYSCPNTTLFQQRMLICDHWYMVNCSKAELDYGANLLIGQRGKPFVEDGGDNPYHRTPRPDLLAHPSAAEFNIIYRTGRAQGTNSKNLVGADKYETPKDANTPAYFLPSHWSTEYGKGGVVTEKASFSGKVKNKKVQNKDEAQLQEDYRKKDEDNRKINEDYRKNNEDYRKKDEDNRKINEDYRKNNEDYRKKDEEYRKTQQKNGGSFVSRQEDYRKNQHKNGEDHRVEDYKKNHHKDGTASLVPREEHKVEDYRKTHQKDGASLVPREEHRKTHHKDGASLVPRTENHKNTQQKVEDYKKTLPSQEDYKNTHLQADNKKTHHKGDTSFVPTDGLGFKFTPPASLKKGEAVLKKASPPANFQKDTPANFQKEPVAFTNFQNGNAALPFQNGVPGVNFHSDFKATTPVYPLTPPTELPLLQQEDFESKRAQLSKILLPPVANRPSVNFPSNYKATTPVYPKVAPPEATESFFPEEINAQLAPPQKTFNFEGKLENKVNFASNFRATTPVYPTSVTPELPLASEEPPAQLHSNPYGLSSIIEPPKHPNQKYDFFKPVKVNFRSDFKATTPVYPKFVTPETPLAIQDSSVDPNKLVVSTVIQPPRAYAQNNPSKEQLRQDGQVEFKELRRLFLIPDYEFPLDASAVRPNYDQGLNSFQVNPFSFDLTPRKHA